MRNLNIVIAGSRTFDDYNIVKSFAFSHIKELALKYTGSGQLPTT